MKKWWPTTGRVNGFGRERNLRSTKRPLAQYQSRHQQTSHLLSLPCFAENMLRNLARRQGRPDLYLTNFSRRLYHKMAGLPSPIASQPPQPWLRVRPSNSLTHNQTRFYHGGHYQSSLSQSIGKGLVGASIGSCCLLFYYKSQHPNALDKDFVLSKRNIKEGRWWTMITHTFNHENLSHLFGNMFTVYFFGSNIAMAYGPVTFAALWIGAGVAGAIASLASEPKAEKGRGRYVVEKGKLVERGLVEKGYLGASGSALGLLTAWAFTSPQSRIIFFPLVSLRPLVWVLSYSSIAHPSSLFRYQSGFMSPDSLSGAFTHNLIPFRRA